MTRDNCLQKEKQASETVSTDDGMQIDESADTVCEALGRGKSLRFIKLESILKLARTQD
jgi:hypothetical protein